ncbi:MAG TPA: hypothetical protein QGF58_06710 [Myxococcota bacterium]|nr:hypothetical protein [Myxococcota bacterium]
MWLVWMACQDPAPVLEDTWFEPGCGNGILEDGEACDDGEDNSDTEPDACRSTCVLPECGDAVADSAEACDDGNPIGGDGCTPLCTAEGSLESEPNDSLEEANPWSQTIYGSLGEDDVDCFSFLVRDCQSISARLQSPCPVPATLGLYDLDGSNVGVGTPDDEGCAVLDPADVLGARFADEGDWGLCLEGLQGREVPFYALDVSFSDREDVDYPISEEDDPDGDGLPSRCDDDRDGDGVLDTSDNCPDTPNGPDMGPLSPSDDGFLRTWLAAGPFTGHTSPDECLPSEEALVGEPDVTPELGTAAGELVWTALYSSDDRLGFLTDYGSVSAPREVYIAVYLRVETERTLTLAHGPDDGATVWLDGEVVQEITGCQGTTADQFRAELTLPAGWSQLLIKVHDQGGGWGDYVRFLGEGGEPVTDLELSLSPYASWDNDQVDSDGDGLGDVCDPEP